MVRSLSGSCLVPEDASSTEVSSDEVPCTMDSWIMAQLAFSVVPKIPSVAEVLCSKFEDTLNALLIASNDHVSCWRAIASSSIVDFRIRFSMAKSSSWRVALAAMLQIF